eukprot:scaffold11666_cov199-Ochromonas_danica.AAC.4
MALRNSARGDGRKCVARRAALPRECWRPLPGSRGSAGIPPGSAKGVRGCSGRSARVLLAVAFHLLSEANLFPPPPPPADEENG